MKTTPSTTEQPPRASVPQERGALGKGLIYPTTNLADGEKRGLRDSLAHCSEQRWDSDGSAGNPAGEFGGTGQSHDFVVGQDMAGVTQELFPNMGIHPRGASLALQVWFDSR